MLPGVLPCFILIDCRYRLYQTAPAPYLPRLVRAKRAGIPVGLEIPHLGRKTTNEQRMLRKTGASHVPRQIMARCPIQLASVTCLALDLSQFVDSFDTSQFGRRGIGSRRLDFSNQT